MLKYKVPTCLVVPVHCMSNLERLHLVLRPTLVLHAMQLSNVFTGKQLKLCRKDLKQRKRGEGWVRSGGPNIQALHSGAVHWSRVVVGFNPGIAQEHAAAHHERGGNMPGSACTVTEYKGRFVPAFSSGINRTISSYIFCLQSIHLSFSPSTVLQQYIQSMKSVQVNPPRFTRSFGLVCLASLFLSPGDVIWRIWSSLLFLIESNLLLREIMDQTWNCCQSSYGFIWGTVPWLGELKPNWVFHTGSHTHRITSDLHTYTQTPTLLE